MMELIKSLVNMSVKLLKNIPNRKNAYSEGTTPREMLQKNR